MFYISKLTVTDDKISPIPNESKTSKIKGMTASTIVQCSSARVAIITSINAVTEAIRLIKLENTLEIHKHNLTEHKPF